MHRLAHSLHGVHLFTADGQLIPHIVGKLAVIVFSIQAVQQKLLHVLVFFHHDHLKASMRAMAAIMRRYCGKLIENYLKMLVDKQIYL